MVKTALRPLHGNSLPDHQQCVKPSSNEEFEEEINESHNENARNVSG
jgi:hypothetical protein